MAHRPARSSSLVLASIISAASHAASNTVAATAPAAPPAPSKEFHRGIEYKGASSFFSVGAITVVFPSGPGEPVEVNRRSAEARARWLASAHKNKVVVVADDQLSAEQKQGNLLVLGWNNRAFGSGGPARPFTHGPTGTRFFGIVESDPRVDVLVYHRNPLNWSTYVLFWTRIDPERDRFQVVPRVGSDWAMYRDYHIVRQGMFVPARVWPPARDVVAEADHTSEAFVFPGGRAAFDSPHFHINFDRTKFKDGEIKAIADAREAAYAKATAALGTSPSGFRIVLNVYDTDQTKMDASSVGDPAHEIASARELHFTKRIAMSTSPREEIHLLARERFGPCFLTSVYEGFALSLEPAAPGQEMELLAGQLRSAGTLPPLAAILDEERFRALVSQSGPVSAGIFMTWVRDAYGMPGIRKMYGLTEGTLSALAAALGTPEPSLEAKFTSWADARVAARKSDLDFLAAEAEAQKMRLSGDWAGMAAALRKALAAKPGDPQTLFNLAAAQMRADDLRGAETSLKEILAASLTAADLRFKVFSHYQLGRVLDLAGRRDEALKEYDAVLALPDDHGSHALALERKSKPATREQLE